TAGRMVRTGRRAHRAVRQRVHSGQGAGAVRSGRGPVARRRPVRPGRPRTVRRGDRGGDAGQRDAAGNRPAARDLHRGDGNGRPPAGRGSGEGTMTETEALRATIAAQLEDTRTRTTLLTDAVDGADLVRQ